MINGNLKELSIILDGELKGSNAEFKGVSIDTRTIDNNNLFVAIKGPHYDGHDYVNKLKEKNIACAIVDRKNQNDYNVPTIAVEDTIYALGELAKSWRDRFSIPLIGITGSNGKTTTKEMTALILSQNGNVLKTEGNFNNLIGLPLTMFRLNQSDSYAVLEMGMNAPGEIRRLAEIANPEIGLITSVTAAHLEKLHTVEAVAHAKAELFETMEHKGIAIVNDEDPWIKSFGKKFKGDVISFGMQNDSTIKFLYMEHEGWDKTELKISVDGREVDLSIPVPGIHNVMNSMAAMAVGYALNLDPEESASRLKNFKPISMRMERVQLSNGVCLVNDTYNANPGSWNAALRTVSAVKRKGRFIAVLGEMLELGESAKGFTIKLVN